MADRNELPAGLVSAEEARRLRVDEANARWRVERYWSDAVGPAYEVQTEAEESVALVVDINDPHDLAEATLCAAAPALRDTVEHLWAEVARLQALLAASPLRVAPSEHDGSAA